MKVPLSHKFISAAAMFCIIIALLITSAQFAIYGDSEYGFYEKEYEKYNVTSSTGVSMETTMDITETMMDYLIGKEDELKYRIDYKSEYGEIEFDFFNEQDRAHMKDVRRLFLGALVLRWILLAAGVITLVLIALRGRNVRRMLFTGYMLALGVCLLIMAFLAVAFSIDFSACFTVFHHIFFSNDLWLFDPAVDLMIRMLPEGFFFDMVLRIALFFVLSLAALWILLFILYRTEKIGRV
jgi:integral membrane protein (TIGR01906 family)